MKDNDLTQIEGDIVDALLEAAEYKLHREQRTVVIKRGGKNLFSFRVEGLTEDQWRTCRRNNLRRHGRGEELDGARFLSQAIYMATIDEDKHIWNNREVWEKIGAVTGSDVVNAILLPGEKSRIGEVLEELSGYNDDLDDLIKN